MPFLVPMADKSIIDSLQNGIANGTNVHAYLFVGEKGLLKRETASYFAAALLCEKGEAFPCGECESCMQASGGNNPDIKRMALGDITSKKSVGADDIRLIISDVYTKPFKSSKKIYIIEDGDALTPQAQNAMLKVLEEPPLYAVFIICVTNAELILPTVRSRSRIVRFALASDEHIAAYVKEKYPHMAEHAGFVASFAGGIIGRADFICSDEAVMDMRARALIFVEKLLVGDDENAIFKMCDEFEAYKKEKNAAYDSSVVVLDFILSFLSDMLYIMGGAADMCANSDKRRQLCELSGRTSYGRVYNAAQRVLETKQMLSRYVSHKAAIMHFALSVFYED